MKWIKNNLLIRQIKVNVTFITGFHKRWIQDSGSKHILTRKHDTWQHENQVKLSTVKIQTSIKLSTYDKFERDSFFNWFVWLCAPCHSVSGYLGCTAQKTTKSTGTCGFGPIY